MKIFTLSASSNTFCFSINLCSSSFLYSSHLTLSHSWALLTNENIISMPKWSWIWKLMISHWAISTTALTLVNQGNHLLFPLYASTSRFHVHPRNWLRPLFRLMDLYRDTFPYMWKLNYNTNHFPRTPQHYILQLRFLFWIYDKDLWLKLRKKCHVNTERFSFYMTDDNGQKHNGLGYVFPYNWFFFRNNFLAQTYFQNHYNKWIQVLQFHSPDPPYNSGPCSINFTSLENKKK